MLLISAVFVSCKKYDYYQNNPNKPTNATASLLLTNISVNVFELNFHSDGSGYASRYATYYERTNTAVDYGWSQGSFGNYDVLRQVAQMDQLAQTAGQPAYTGLAHFFRAVLFSQLTETFGDVPYSRALQASSNVTKPVYDKQEDIYAGILNELDQANTILAQAASANTKITGDIIFNGSPVQWQKAVNAFKLRLLIHLSKKTGDTKLNVIDQFKAIITNPTNYPLMTGIPDNAQLVYNTSATSNYYPTYNSISVLTLVSLEKGFADTLISKTDPRLFSFGLPVAGKAAGVFANYAGVNAGLTATQQQNSANSASLINPRYANSMVNEPTMLIGYPEQEFLIAEAITRGWISAGPGGSVGSTAAACYNNGITASMQFYNTYASAGISDQAITAYLAQPSVVLNSSSTLNKILTQKYIAMFLQSDYEPFFEQRRTGIPTFDVGPGTLNGGKVPKRWMYPTNEFEQNNANVTAAVKSQYNGTDDVNGLMWVLQ